MFTNLKNKLIEEVKASPSKLHQFANAAQAVVSSSASTTSNGSETTATATNEKFFSITEEDTPQNSPFKPLKQASAAMRGRFSSSQTLNSIGTISRIRRSSNSSVASDVSFRLPTFDSTSVYHLHSDLEASGSEMGELDDSTTTAKLDVVNKEQLYDAYKKSLDRYHKYRCRYTDLAKKYKDLERDSTKARSVLVETQEKAIRRINELREQCALEQQAKAHLEEALRVEMDDMQCKMQAYQTKLRLMGENLAIFPATELQNKNETNQSLIDLGFKNDSDVESIEKQTAARIKLLEEQLEDRENQLKVLTEKMEESKVTIENLKAKEEENILLIAQTKQAIHSGLEAKEKEVRKATNTLTQFNKSELKAFKNCDLLLNEEFKEIGEITDKLNQIKREKQEAEAKVIASERKLTELKGQFVVKDNTIILLEEQMLALSKDSQQELLDLKQQNVQLNETIQRYQQNEISLAEIDSELNHTKNENGDLKALIEVNERKFNELEKELKAIKELNEGYIKKHNALLESMDDKNAEVEELQKHLREEKKLLESDKTDGSKKIKTLKEKLLKVKEDLNDKIITMQNEISSKEEMLETAVNNFQTQQSKFQIQLQQINEQSEEIMLLRNELHENERQLLMVQTAASKREEQTEREKTELKKNVTSILNEISKINEELSVVRQSHSELEAEKRSLEVKIECMQSHTQDALDGKHILQEELATLREELKQTTVKLQAFENENLRYSEENSFLRENNDCLERMLTKKQEEDTIEEAVASSKLKTAEDVIMKLREKLSKVLDENSRLHNEQELMEHDQRSLQDKCDALEKEKLLALDSQKCLEEELKRMKGDIVANNLKLKEATEKIKKSEIELSTKTNELEILTIQFTELQHIREDLENEAQANNDQKRNSVEEKNQFIIELKRKLDEKEAIYSTKIKHNEEEITVLRKQILDLEMHTEKTKHMVAELQLERKQKNLLNDELNTAKNNLNKEKQKRNELALKFNEHEIIKQQLSFSKVENHKLDAELHVQLEKLKTIEKLLEMNKLELQENKRIKQDLSNQLAERLKKYDVDVSDLNEKLNSANSENKNLHDINETLETKMHQLTNMHQSEVHNLKARLKNLKEHIEELQNQEKILDEEKLTRYNQIELERELLNTKCKELENSMAEQQKNVYSKDEENAELMEKIKSMQCELYVLQENANKHNAQLDEKQNEIVKTRIELEKMQEMLDCKQLDQMRQNEHLNYVNKQSDHIQKKLVEPQQKVAESGQQSDVKSNEVAAIQKKIDEKSSVINRHNETIETLNMELLALTAELQTKEKLVQELSALKVESLERQNNEPKIEDLNSVHLDSENVSAINQTLRHELQDLSNSQVEISNLQRELEDVVVNSDFERLSAVEQADTAVTNINRSVNSNIDQESEEKEAVELKLQEIMSEVHKVSNLNSFLEQKCENYLILEQANERLKLQNSKLSRQLDETLVSIQYSESISVNTEFEYLKNIMFQYLTGSANGNNETLVKVISAVLKFSPQQTQVALEKEHQRRSLINKIL